MPDFHTVFPLLDDSLSPSDFKKGANTQLFAVLGQYVMIGTLYLFDNDDSLTASASIIRLKQRPIPPGFLEALPVYISKKFPQLIPRIRKIQKSCAVVC